MVTPQTCLEAWVIQLEVDMGCFLDNVDTLVLEQQDVPQIQITVSIAPQSVDC